MTSRIFGKVAAKSQIPLISMYVFSLLAAILAVILDIDTLVEMMSIGTLSAYLVVSGGVIIFRYRPNQITKVAMIYFKKSFVKFFRLDFARTNRDKLPP